MASEAKSNTLYLWNDSESQNNFIYYLLGGFLIIFVLCFLVTRALRRKEPNVMVLTSLEDDCFETEPHTYYVVVVSTSYLPGSSCNRNIKVFIQLEGEHGNTPYIRLKTNYAGQNILQRGVTDLFLVKVREKIGKIEGVVFVMSTGAEKHITWRVRCVKLYNPYTEVMMSPSVKIMVIESSVEFHIDQLHMKESRYHTLGRSLIRYHQWLSVPNTKVRYGAYTETVNILMIFTAFGILLVSSLIAYILSDTNDNPDLFEVSALPLLLGSFCSAILTFIITSAIELQMHFVACREKDVGLVYSMVRKDIDVQGRTTDKFYFEDQSMKRTMNAQRFQRITSDKFYFEDKSGYPLTQETCCIDLEETASSVSGYGRLLSLWNSLDWINIKRKIARSFSDLLIGKRTPNTAEFDRQASLRTLYKSCQEIDQDFINEMRKRHYKRFLPSHAKHINEILYTPFPDIDAPKDDITKKQEEPVPSQSKETKEQPVSYKLSQRRGTLYRSCIDFDTAKDSIAKKYEQPLPSQSKQASAKSYKSKRNIDKSKEDITKKQKQSVPTKGKLFKSVIEMETSEDDKSKLTGGLGVSESSFTDRATFIEDIRRKHEQSVSDQSKLGKETPFKPSLEIDMSEDNFVKKRQQYASAQLRQTNNVTFKSVIDLPGGIHKSKSDIEISSSVADYLSLDFQVTVGRIVIADTLSADKGTHDQKSKSLEDIYLDEFTGHRGTDLLTYIEELVLEQNKLVEMDSDLSDSSLDEISLETTSRSSPVFVSVPGSSSEESLSTDCFNTRSSQYVIDIPSPFWESCSNTATAAYQAVTSETESQRFNFDNACGTRIIPERYRPRDHYKKADSATFDAEPSSQRKEQTKLQTGRGNKIPQDSSPIIAGYCPSGVSYDEYKHKLLEPVFYKINLTTGLPPNQKLIDVVVKKTREKSHVGLRKESSMVIDIHLGDKDLEKMQESASRSISDLADESIRAQLKPINLDQLLQFMRNGIRTGITWSYITVFEKQRDLQLWSRSHIESMACTLKNFKKQAEKGNLLFSTAFDQGKVWFKDYLIELCVVLGWDLNRKNPDGVWQELEKNMSHVFGMASEAVCKTLKGTCQLLLRRDTVTLADLLLKSHEVMKGIEANSISIAPVERDFRRAHVKPDLSSELDHIYRTIAHTIFIEAVRLGFREQRVPWNLFLKIFRKKNGEIFEEYVRKITSLLIYSSETIVKEYDGESFMIKALCCYITRLAKEELWKEYQDIQLVLTDMLFKQTTLNVLKKLAKSTTLTICKQVEELLRQKWIIQGYNPSKRGEIALAQALLCAREMCEDANGNKSNNNKDVFEVSYGINKVPTQHAKLVTYLQFKRVETGLAACLLAMVQLEANDLVIDCLQEYLSQQLSSWNKKQETGAQMDNWKKQFIAFVAESISVKLNLQEEEFARRDYCQNLLDAVLETESLKHDFFMQTTLPRMQGNQRIKTNPRTEANKIEKVSEQLLARGSDRIESTCITEMISELKPIRKYMKFVGMIEDLRGRITKENYLARIKKEQQLFIQIQLQNVVDSFYILYDDEVTPKIDRTTLYQLEYDTMGDSRKPLPPTLKIVLMILICLMLAFSEVYTYLVGGQLSTTQVKEWFCYFSLSIVKFGFVFEVIKALLFGMFFASSTY